MIEIKRMPSDDQGTYGFWYDGDQEICMTLELPWKDNEPQISCIPIGVYSVIDYNSPTKGIVWLLQGVPGRSMIEIHTANVPSQLLGCIAVGDSEGTLDGEIAVLNSVETLKMLRSKYTAPFTLKISNLQEPSPALY